jgi:hypothetical protein
MWSWTEPGAARSRRQCIRIVKGSGGDLAMRRRPQTAAPTFSGVSQRVVRSACRSRSDAGAHLGTLIHVRRLAMPSANASAHASTDLVFPGGPGKDSNIFWKAVRSSWRPAPSACRSRTCARCRRGAAPAFGEGGGPVCGRHAAVDGPTPWRWRWCGGVGLFDDGMGPWTGPPRGVAGGAVGWACLTTGWLCRRAHALALAVVRWGGPV